MKQLLLLVYIIIILCIASCSKSSNNSSKVITLTTIDVTSIITTTASSGGNITSDGGSSVTARGVVWSTSPSPTIALSSKTSDGTGTGIFPSNITGLTPSTTYYVKAYATNANGTYYGNELSFQTLPLQLYGAITPDCNVNMMPLNQWTYIAITRVSGGTGSLYKNGQLICTANYGAGPFSFVRIDLGAVYFTGYKSWFDGWIDEVRISNTVRSSADIYNYYNSNLPLSSDVNTIGLWHFDESSGTSISSVVGPSGTTNGSFASGKFGNCVYYNGSNAYSSINTSVPTTNMTYEFWIKPRVPPATGSSSNDGSWPFSLYGTNTSGFGLKYY